MCFIVKLSNQHDTHARPREFQLGSKVMVKGRRPGSASWIPEKITQKSGSLTYEQGGRAWKCHVDQLTFLLAPLFPCYDRVAARNSAYQNMRLLKWIHFNITPRKH